MPDKKTPRVSYSLEEKYQELFDRITEETRRSKTQELRIMLDMRAAMLGLPPVNPIDLSSTATIVRKRILA
jgi:hypothetical protein